MVVGAGRRVGAGFLAAGAAFLALGVLLVAQAVWALEDQAADLDPSERRAALQAAPAMVGGSLAALGLLFAFIGALTYLISSVRSHKREAPRPSAPRTVALVSLGVILVVLLFALVFPRGPLMTGLAVASGGGAGAVEVRAFDGELTAATVGGIPTAEHVYDPKFIAKAGAIRLRLGSGGEGFNAAGVAILEEADGNGGWREVARTSPTQDTVDVPSRSYPLDLRVRVQLAEGTAGTIQYILGVSLAPSR